MSTATMTPTSLVTDLIQRFLALDTALAAQQWDLADLVASIFETGGAQALHTLADQSRHSYAVLRRWSRLATQIPLALRHSYPLFTLNFFDELLRATTKFAYPLPEATLAFWCEAAQRAHWSRGQLRQAVRQRWQTLQMSQASTAPETRRSVLASLTAQAEREAQALQDRVQRFNRQYAPYYLKTLVLQEVVPSSLVPASS